MSLEMCALFFYNEAISQNGKFDMIFLTSPLNSLQSINYSYTWCFVMKCDNGKLYKFSVISWHDVLGRYHKQEDENECADLSVHTFS